MDMRLATSIAGNELTIHLKEPTGGDIRGYIHAAKFLFGPPAQTRVKGDGFDTVCRMGHRWLIVPDEDGHYDSRDTKRRIAPRAVERLTLALPNGRRVKYLELDALVDEALGGGVMTKDEVLASVANDLLAGRVTEEQHAALVAKVEAWE
jgi:hypothetical protein